MKRIFSLVLAIILIFNFVSFSYAEPDTIDRLIDVDPKSSGESLSTPSTTSPTTPPYESEDGDDNESPSLGILGTIWNVFENIFNVLGRNLANLVYMLPTIDGIIFNTNNIFDVTIFENNPNNLSGSLQATVSAIYNAFRYLVTAVYIVVLVYLAIRMMLSSIGRQKAKYKEMFKYWLIGLLLLFSFHWVMAGIIWLSNTIVNILYTQANNFFEFDFNFSEFDDLKSIWVVKQSLNVNPDFLHLYPITNYIVHTILYTDFHYGLGIIATLFLPITSIVFTVLLLWSSLSIIVTYFKRFFTILVLILIFPIVVLSYVFDKIGDRKAQTFSYWIREFVTNVMIQPIHALILTFIAIILAKSSSIYFLNGGSIFAPIFCLLALRLIPMGEELLKKLFQISSQMGPGARGIAGSMAQAGLAIRVQKI